MSEQTRGRGRPSKIEEVRQGWGTPLPAWAQSLDTIIARANDGFTLEAALEVIEQHSGVKISINTLRRWIEAAKNE